MPLFFRYSNKLVVLHPSCQKKEAVEHLRHIERCYNKHTLKRINFGIASVIWVNRFSIPCSEYNSNCPHLERPYSKFNDGILDFGFLNIWWVLSRRMLDYDINY